MLLKLGLGMAASVLVIFSLHTLSHNYTLWKAQSFSIKNVVRMLSSLGVILPIECFLVYVFLSYNGVGGLTGSALFTQHLVIYDDLFMSVMGQQAFIVNALRLISAITFGSAVIFTFSAGVEFILSRKKKTAESNTFTQDEPAECESVFSCIRQDFYLEFGGFLS